MFQMKNFLNNDDMRVVNELGPFKVVEYQRDLSVTPDHVMQEWFMSQMNVRRRQLIVEMGRAKSGITLQSGAMQWMAGDVNSNTGIKGAGDLLGKVVRGKVTGESAIKPEYHGTGALVCEPTYKHILLMNVEEWRGGLVVEDGMFLACEASIQHRTQMRSNISSAVAGGEGLFNLCMSGSGVAALESWAPLEELIEINLEDDVLKIDGSYAIAWSASLNFSVERSGKSLIGSAASGEGLVNVYRGSGKVLMRPL